MLLSARRQVNQRPQVRFSRDGAVLRYAVIQLLERGQRKGPSNRHRALAVRGALDELAEHIGARPRALDACAKEVEARANAELHRGLEVADGDDAMRSATSRSHEVGQRTSRGRRVWSN
jgi:hypothetical protein